jgi:hypothetical protein
MLDGGGAVVTDQIPFSNGTEERAWQSVWCEHCVHDHDISHASGGTMATPGCEILALSVLAGTDDWRWPEVWIPEPPSLGFNLPSLMLCGQFEPCHRDDCDGDPHAEVRVEVTVRVKAAWDEDRKRVPA